MPKPYCLLLLLLFSLYSSAQEAPFLEGRIKDAHGQALSDAILWTGSDSLQRSDSLGYFHLPVQDDASALWIWHPRTGARAFSLDFHFREFLAIQMPDLPEESVGLGDSTVRQLLQNSPKYAERFKHYHATVYQENQARVRAVPFDLIGFSGVAAPPTDQVGTAYRSTALKKVRYYDRFHFQERVLKQKEAGYILAENWHYLPHYALNPYREQFFVNGMTNRPYFSALHPANAERYHYRQQAQYIMAGEQVIRVHFSGKADQSGTVSGIFDMLRSSGKLLAIQYDFGPESQMEGIDTLRIAMHFWPFGDDYRKLRQSHYYRLDLLGFSFSYVSKLAYLRHQFTSDQRDSVADLLSFERNALAYRPEADSLLASVKPPAWPADSSFYKDLNILRDQPQWRFFRGSRLYRDRFNWYSWLFQGHLFQKGQYYLGWMPFYRALGFNAIEGPYLRYAIPLGKTTSRYEWEFAPEARYGFSEQKLKLRADWRISFDTLHPKSIRLSGGRAYRQFNPEQPVLPVINGINALLLGENLIRLYETDYLSAGYAFEAATGLSINLQTEYGIRRPIFNSTDFTFFERDHRYNPNNPTVGNVIRSFGFEPHRSLKVSAEINYQFGQQYELRFNPRNHSRFVAKNNLKIQKPSLYLNNYWGLPTAYSVTNYWFTSVGMQYLFRTDLGLAQMDISGGFFPIKERVPFVDFKHFDGIQLFFLQPTPNPRNRIKQFGTLPYYRFSTREPFLEMHLEHFFEGTLLPHIDWLKRSRIHFLMGYNGLYLGNGRHFNEAFIGFDNIFKVMRLEFFLGKPSDAPWRQTVRVGFDINYRYYLNHRRKIKFQPL